MKTLNVGYVLKRFPRLSETFILNEVLELERQGVPIEIFALLEPAEELRHETLKRLQSTVTYLPQGSLITQWRIREGRYAEGTFLERPFKELFHGGKPPEASVLSLQAAALAILAQARGVNHLHAHFGTGATTVTMLAGRLTGIPYSFTAHAKDIYHESVDTALLTQKIREARFVITVSEYNRRHLAELAGKNMAGKILRLYNGIDLDRFRPDLSICREPGLILAVGRLVEKKGFHYLVQACRLLKDRGRPFRCLIIGEGPERASLTQQISTLELEDRVILVGAQPQGHVLETLKRAAVLVLPCVVSSTGDRDGLPTVLLEALAVGLPAISTTLTGIPEIIEHGNALVPPGDSIRLAMAVEEVLTNPELQQRLGLEGRSKAEKDFDIRKNVLILQDLFARSAGGQNDCFEPAGPRSDRERQANGQQAPWSSRENLIPLS
jgi:glycosyltransferase involved in cell wall biosynthesis